MLNLYYTELRNQSKNVTLYIIFRINRRKVVKRSNIFTIGEKDYKGKYED